MLHIIITSPCQEPEIRRPVLTIFYTSTSHPSLVFICPWCLGRSKFLRKKQRLLWIGKGRISWSQRAARVRKFHLLRPALLYSNDWLHHGSLLPDVSVGRWYIQPLGSEIQRRSSVSSVRTVSLSPTCISTNMVFNFSIANIFKLVLKIKISWRPGL